MEEKKKVGFWNIANIITVLRLLIVPVVMYLMTVPGRTAAWWALWLFVGAALSDIVDGYLARKLGLQSTMGAFLDPLADKLLVTGAMIMLIPMDRLPAWMVAVLILRELTITALRSMAMSEGLVISASEWGKYKTAFQDTGLSFLIFGHSYMGVDTVSVGLVLMYFSLFFSVYSGVHYFVGFARETT